MERHFSQMTAIGRPFQLGDLYDYHSDHILTECRLGWEPSDLPTAISVVNEFQLKILTCLNTESWKKWEHMGLNEHLQASTVSGLIDKFKGASHYLTDRSSPTEASRTLVCRTISRTERLDLPTLLNHNVPAIPVDGTLPKATHVVVGILYGAEIYCILAQDINEDDEGAREEAEENLSKISAKMENALEDNQDVAEFRELFDKKEKLLISRLQCRIYADLQAQPVKECGVFEAYKHCLKLIEKIKTDDVGESKSVPINIILCSVKAIVGTTGGLGKMFEYRDVDGDLVVRLCRIWNELEKVVAKADAVRAISKKASRVSLRQFGEVVGQFQHLLKENWKEGIVKSRQTQDGEEDLEKSAGIAERHPLFKPSRLERWLSYKKAEMEMAAKMANIDGITVLASKSELEKELAESFDKKFSLVLTIPPLDERTNDVLRLMKNCVANVEMLLAGEGGEADSADEEDELPWHVIRRKRKQVLDKIRELSDYVEKNKHLEKQVQFFVMFGESGKRFGCRYSVYQSETLLKDDLVRLPGPPTGLRTRSAPSAVRLLWDYEDYGWPCHFVVQYRLKDDLDATWKQQKTSKPGETQSIIKCGQGSVLEVRVAAETCVGLGEFSDIVDTESALDGIEETEPMEKKLQPPTDIKLKIIRQTTAELVWSPPHQESIPSVSSYRIRYWRNGQASSVREIQIESNETSCLLDQLQPGVTYLANIYAISNDGLETSGPSETAEWTTLVNGHSSYPAGQQPDGLPSYRENESPAWTLLTSSQLLSTLKVFAFDSVQCLDKLWGKTLGAYIQLIRILILFLFVTEAFKFYNERKKENVNMPWVLKCLVLKFVLVNFVGKLTATVMIIFRKHVEIACALLFGILCMQVAYGYLQTLVSTVVWTGFQSDNVTREILYILFILAEHRLDWRTYLLRNSSLIREDKAPKSQLQLTARVLLLFAFVTFQRMEFSFFYVFQNFVASLLMLFITIDYKTETSAWILTAWVFFYHIYLWSDWWFILYRCFVIPYFINGDEQAESQKTISGKFFYEIWLESVKLGKQALRLVEPILPALAKLCALSTFIEDGWRLFRDWDEETEHLAYGDWQFSMFLATLLINVNLFGQLAGAFMILLRWKMDVACAILFAIICLKIVVSDLTEVIFLYLSIVGVILLLLAETARQGNPVFGCAVSTHYLQLAGRILFVPLFIYSMIPDTDGFRYIEVFFNVFFYIVGSVLMLFVALGYKTRLSASILGTLLVLYNFYANCWWTVVDETRDYRQYEFFQVLSIVGGLMLLASLGPGNISVDQYLKGRKPPSHLD